MAEFEVGEIVKWDWGNGTGTGKITERFTEKTSRSIRGADVTRNASEDAPAFLIEQEDGARVLNSITEIEKT